MKLYKYTTADYGLAAIRDGQLKVTTITDANDPNEWLPVMLDSVTGKDWHANPNFRGQFRYMWSHNYGFISLSKQYNDLLMWGHYADKFKGVVLEFDMLDESKKINVDYVSDRYVLDNSIAENPTMEALEKLVARKDKSWAHEDECRILINLKSCTTKRLSSGDTIYFSPFASVMNLTGVILGSESTVTLLDICQALHGKPPIGFSVIQLAADSNKYSLVISDFKKWNGNDWVSQEG